MSDQSIRIESPRRLVTPAAERFLLVLALLIFAGALHVSHAVYLQPSWERLGITYATPDAARYSFGLILILAAALVVPTKFTAPSSVFIMALLFVVFVPTVVITLGLHEAALGKYGLALSALAVAFFSACLVCRKGGAESQSGALPGPIFVRALLIVWVIASAVIFLVYGGRLRIVGFSDVYEQREAGQATSAAVAYLQTYYLNVICPAVLAIGLLDRKRPWMIVIGLAGFGLAYSIAAQKSALFVPFVMLGVYAAMTTVGRLLGLTTTIAIALASAIGVAVCVYLQVGDNWLAAIVVHRTIAIPGLTFSQYSDFFGEAGYTLWSHVRGFSAIMPAPPSLTQNPLWPSLGHLVGESAYGDAAHNLNANLFASDGIAAAGPIGVLTIGLVFALWLMVLDWAGQGWNQRLAALVLLPVAVSLTNGPLFTVLLSFGGIFWTALFAVYKPSEEVIPFSGATPQEQPAKPA